ncbi:MAG: small conductance mechanosensitive channel [Methyloprofundus sp.]|nr:MAG: small conductance mechanosensitive channel [Methyloprofundus sp.]
MQINLKKILPLLLVLFISITPISVCAEEELPPPSTVEAIKEDPSVKLLAESKTILANIKQLTQQATELKEVSAEIPDFDQLLFMTLLISIESDIYVELDRLIAIQQKLDQATEAASLLKIDLQKFSVKQESTLRNEIHKLKELGPKLSKQTAKGSSTSFSIERARQIIFDLLVEWQKNIDRQKLLEMNVTASVAELSKIVQFVAIAQTGRIQLSLDAIAELNIAMEEAAPDDQLQITKQLHKETLRKSQAAANLEKMLGIMTSLEMDTTKFGQALVLATGKILHADVETKAVIGLFKKLFDQAMFWLQENLSFIIFRIFSFVLLIFAFKVLASLVRRLVDKATASSQFEISQLLKDFLGSIAHKIVMIIGLMVALSQLGIEIAPLLAGMGIMGFVIGFALQDTLSNFASGLMILIYRPFDIGNFVDVAGISGEVKQMNLVSTTILTVDRKRMIIPNSKIWGDIITNVTAESIRRVDFVFGIGYEDSISAAEEILRDIVTQHELILNNPEAVIKVHALGESSVDFVVRPWVKSTDYWDVYWDITRQVKERFDAGGISIPYPQRDVHVIPENKGAAL